MEWEARVISIIAILAFSFFGYWLMREDHYHKRKLPDIQQEYYEKGQWDAMTGNRLYEPHIDTTPSNMCQDCYYVNYGFMNTQTGVFRQTYFDFFDPHQDTIQ